MYYDAVFEDPHSLQFVSDWFVTQKLAKIWNNDNGYKKRKTLIKKKNQIDRDFLHVEWHSS